MLEMDGNVNGPNTRKAQNQRNSVYVFVCII